MAYYRLKYRYPHEAISKPFHVEVDGNITGHTAVDSGYFVMLYSQVKFCTIFCGKAARPVELYEQVIY